MPLDSSSLLCSRSDVARDVSKAYIYEGCKFYLTASILRALMLHLLLKIVAISRLSAYFLVSTFFSILSLMCMESLMYCIVYCMLSSRVVDDHRFIYINILYKQLLSRTVPAHAYLCFVSALIKMLTAMTCTIPNILFSQHRLLKQKAAWF